MPDKTLIEMQEEVYQNNLEHGWFDTERTFGDDIALLHSEVSELFEAFRSDVSIDFLAYEAADILIRLLDTCKRYSINLPEAFDIKMEINRSRPYRHGNKVV